MTSVYVAGKYTDYMNIREYQAKCVESGFTISYDWTQAAEKHILGGKTKIHAIDALDDIDGVLQAKWTVLIMTDPDYSYRGTFCELGASLVRDMNRGVRRTIIVSNGVVAAATPGWPIRALPAGLPVGLAAADCVFFHHPNAQCVATIEEALHIMRTCHL